MLKKDLVNRIIEKAQSIRESHPELSQINHKGSLENGVVSFYIKQNGIFKRKTKGKLESHSYPIALVTSGNKWAYVIFNPYVDAMKELGKFLKNKKKGGKRYTEVREQLTLYRETVKTFYNSLLHIEGYTLKKRGGRNLTLELEVKDDKPSSTDIHSA